MTDLRDKIVGALNIEGAFCGTCDREPGQSLYCTACVQVLKGYADAVLAVLDLDTIRAEAFEAGVRSAVDAVNSTPPSNLKPYLRGAEQ